MNLSHRLTDELAGEDFTDELSIIENLTDRTKQQCSKTQTLKQSKRHHLEPNHRQTPKPQPYVSNITLTRFAKLYLVNSTGRNL